MAFVFAQSMFPTFEMVKDCPEILATLFKLTIPGNVLLLFAFLYELTFYDQHQRQTIFQTQLAKVFFTNLTIYLFSVVYSHWI